ncbi:uncharacterized protein LY79DRAFT_346278 [Colletotrichum navitas]|uniref:Uncharacterized protein n=1 Tax=Colletotrichum navitas TaxID=681940 RepID=A0AAD8PRD9_9PEZI|nr:uncharacterized protein LY79DRAFT_346278 [Colletotrichum navitas]KAK1579316.1 hypothetical protein LY79DRAFT_346278 [Colletotrichum navitas]
MGEEAEIHKRAASSNRFGVELHPRPGLLIWAEIGTLERTMGGRDGEIATLLSDLSLSNLNPQPRTLQAWLNGSHGTEIFVCFSNFLVASIAGSTFGVSTVASNVARKQTNLRPDALACPPLCPAGCGALLRATVSPYRPFPACVCMHYDAIQLPSIWRG